MDKPDHRLIVSLYGDPVGAIDRREEGSSFAFDEAALDRPDRPVLGQVFEDDLTGRFSTGQGVPSWFANLLPEGPLRSLIAERAGVHEDRSYYLLALTGQDLAGAVTVHVEGSLTDPEATPVSPSAAPEGNVLKFSLAGVQLKFSAVRNARGLTIPAEGRGGSWIVKLPDQRYAGVPENEFTMLSWARTAGILVPDVELVDVAAIEGLPAEIAARGGKALAIARFDRPIGGNRLHIEDFAQVLGVGPKEKYRAANYETIARIVAATGGQDDVDELVRRLAFAILIGNGDAHLKNWSLIYPDRRNPRLAPAYDLVATIPYAPNDTLGLKLGGSRDLSTMTARRLKTFAERAHLDEDRVLATASELVERAADAWHDGQVEWPALENVRSHIAARVDDVAFRPVTG